MKLLQTVKSVLKAYRDLLTGKLKRDRQELNDKLQEALQEAAATGVALKDYSAYHAFSHRKALEYFNERAAREPEQAEGFLRLSKLAADVSPQQMRGDIDAYPASESNVKEWHLTVERYSAELLEFEKGRIGEFISENPERWERMKKSLPNITDSFT